MYTATKIFNWICDSVINEIQPVRRRSFGSGRRILWQISDTDYRLSVLHVGGKTCRLKIVLHGRVYRATSLVQNARYENFVWLDREFSDGDCCELKLLTMDRFDWIPIDDYA